MEVMRAHQMAEPNGWDVGRSGQLCACNYSEYDARRRVVAAEANCGLYAAEVT